MKELGTNARTLIDAARQEDRLDPGQKVALRTALEDRRRTPSLAFAIALGLPTLKGISAIATGAVGTACIAVAIMISNVPDHHLPQTEPADLPHSRQDRPPPRPAPSVAGPLQSEVHTDEEISQNDPTETEPPAVTPSEPAPAVRETRAPRDEHRGVASQAQHPTPSLPQDDQIERTSTVPPQSTLLAEAHILRDAQRALRQNDANRALHILDRHQDQFPRGILSQEREGARLIAQCQTQQAASVQRDARNFIAAHPQSPVSARVRAACRLQDDFP